MSIITREQIMTALFNKLKACTWVQGSSTVPIFKTTSRKLKLWGNVPPQQRPALFMAEQEEHPSHDAPEVPMRKLELDVELFIYIDTTNITGISVLNNIRDALDVVMQPDDFISMKLTLGGLVQHCWIDGKVLKDPGDLDNDGLMMINIKILVP